MTPYFKRDILALPTWKSRHVYSDMVVTDWVDFDEAGSTLISLINYLEIIWGDRVVLSKLYGHAYWRNFQFKCEAVNVSDIVEE